MLAFIIGYSETLCEVKVQTLGGKEERYECTPAVYRYVYAQAQKEGKYALRLGSMVRMHLVVGEQGPLVKRLSLCTQATAQELWQASQDNKELYADMVNLIHELKQDLNSVQA